MIHVQCCHGQTRMLAWRTPGDRLLPLSLLSQTAAGDGASHYPTGLASVGQGPDRAPGFQIPEVHC